MCPIFFLYLNYVCKLYQRLLLRCTANAPKSTIPKSKQYNDYYQHQVGEKHTGSHTRYSVEAWQNHFGVTFHFYLLLTDASFLNMNKSCENTKANNWFILHSLYPCWYVVHTFLVLKRKTSRSKLFPCSLPYFVFAPFSYSVFT